MWGSSLIILVAFAAAFGAVAVKDIVTAKRNGRKYLKRNCVAAYTMMLPAVVLAFIFVLLPIVYSLGYAFTDYYLLKPNNIHFNGIENFKTIFKSFSDKGDVYNAVRNTAKFVVGVVPLQIGMALGLALFVNRSKRFVGVFKVCYFAPVVISLTITAYLWLQILSPAETGLLNSLLKKFGKEPQDFMRDAKAAIRWIVFISAWQGCGYQMLIFLSGLTNVRKELYEAAALDGANGWQQFLHVTCPGLRSTFLFVLITVFVGACRVMVQPMLMTGYQSHTITISYYMYVQGYSYRLVGESSAVALLMTIVIGTITLIQRKVLKED